MAVATDLECPECGLPWSSSEPQEMFDGFTIPEEVRACLHDGRVYLHSDGDVNGYE